MSWIMNTHALTWLLLLFPGVFCALVNVTIDDSDPSIKFLPLGAWNARSATAPCTGCTANPDTNKVFDGTFHDGTFNPVAGSNDSPNVPLTASVSFNGTAVYVICALAESTTGPDGNSDMTFFIDGKQVGNFLKPAPGNDNTYDYNVPVLSVSSLTSGQHNLTIQNGHVNGSKSLVLLDQIVYSVDTASTSTFSQSTATSSSASSTTSSNVTGSPSLDSSSKKNIGSIVGPAVAVPIAVLLLAALAICFFLRRRKRQSLGQSNKRLTIDPISPPMTTAWPSEPMSLPASHSAHPPYIDTSGAPVNQSLYTSSSQQNMQAGPSSLHSPPQLHPSSDTSGSSSQPMQAGPSRLRSDSSPSRGQSNYGTASTSRAGQKQRRPSRSARDPSFSTSDGSGGASGPQKSTIAHESGSGPARPDPTVSSTSVQIARDELVSIPNEAPPAYDWRRASRSLRKGFRNEKGRSYREMNQ